jgi:flagellar basal body-associated protein FliL
MKQSVSPVVMVIIVVVAIAVIGLIYWHFSGTNHQGEQPPGMPASVQQEFQKRMGGKMLPPNAGAMGNSSTPSGK